MHDEVIYWIEQGLLATVGYLFVDQPDQRGRSRLVSLLPPVTHLARLWGSLEPARAAGFAAAVGNPMLRAAARAAAMEFAPWPPPTVTPVLRRAEEDATAERWVRTLSPVTVLDLWDGLAIAWARHDPGELPKLYERLHARLDPSAGSGLWRRAMIDAAAARKLLPDPAQTPPGGPTDWARQAQWALTAAQRSRACLALAAAAWRESESDAE